jgi:nucleoside-diphosphate-sugar epimerase
MKQEKIALTGLTGHIGYVLAKKLLERGYVVFFSFATENGLFINF